MNLIDDNFGGTRKSNKKIFIACGVGIVLIIFIIVALLAVVTTMNKGTTLTIDGKKQKISMIIEDEGEKYISIQELVNCIPSNGYTYKKGNLDMPDYDGCYITNSDESTFFKTDSNQYYKIANNSNGTQNINFYTMGHNIKKFDGLLYIPLSEIGHAMNANCTITDKAITIQSIGYIEGIYNQATQAKSYPMFYANNLIKWDVSYSNLKMLKDRLVITKDSEKQDIYGLGIVQINQSGKGKKIVNKVEIKNEIISPMYSSIEYVEEFDNLVVETNSGKGILKIVRDESNNVVDVKNVIAPQSQYKELIQISDELFIIGVIDDSATDNKSSQSDRESAIRYGIINAEKEIILPTEYEKIGIDKAYEYTNNDLNSEYIVLDKYIPVKKNNLWGFVDLTGKEVIKPSYDALGCAESNSSENLYVIPEIKAFIFKNNLTYGIRYFSGNTIITNTLRKFYIETAEGKKTYFMLYKGKPQPVIDYINKMQNNNSKNNTNNTNTTNVTTTTNTTNNTNTTNVTNTTNSTKTTNSTNATNTTKTTNSTNKTNTTNSSSIVIINQTR